MPAESKRYRITVPVTDEVVVAWFTNQENMSASVRAVVKEAVRRHGLADVFSSRLPDGQQTAQPVSEVGERKPAKVAGSEPVKAKAAPRPAQPAQAVQSEPGIKLGADALMDFGIDLDLGAIGASGGEGGDDIAAMMGKE